MAKIYGLIADLGDGSACIRWYKEKPNFREMKRTDPETYIMNDDIEVINLPDSVDLDKIGIDFHTPEN